MEAVDHLRSAKSAKNVYRRMVAIDEPEWDFKGMGEFQFQT